jgi:aquaporin Z
MARPACIERLLMPRHGAIPLGGLPRDAGTADFANGRLEWRRLLAEAGGTFLLVLVAAGAVVVNAVSHGQVGRTAAVTAPGIMVLAMIYTIGATSGAHLNPAVTVAFAARGHFPWRRVPGYVLAQLLGATGAAALLRSMFGTAGRLGGTFPGPGIPAGTALVTETVLSLGLMTVILGTSSGARNVGHNAAIAIGGYIALAGLWASPVSGASMNPARSLGPALVSGDLGVVWIYLAGPVAGGLLAVGLAWALRGHPSPAADLAAQGTAQDALSAAARLPRSAGISGPADTLEVRWIVPGPLTPAMRDWFARFPAGTETRADAYLLRPRLRGLAVKLRHRRTLDLKAFLGSPGLIDLPGGGRGTLELWRKWSFAGDSYGPQVNGDDPGPGWAVVHKKRIGAWFPLTSGDGAAPSDRQAAETGCAVELTEIGVGAERYVSVGFEAQGTPELLRAALEHAAALVFAVAPPLGPGLSFSLDDSQSYAQWLQQQRSRQLP